MNFGLLTPHLWPTWQTASLKSHKSICLVAQACLPRSEETTNLIQGAQHVTVIESWESTTPRTVPPVAGRFDVQAKGSACLHCPNVQTRCQARALRASSRLRTALPLPQKPSFVCRTAAVAKCAPLRRSGVKT